jgi:hypothetical protein
LTKIPKQVGFFKKNLKKGFFFLSKQKDLFLTWQNFECPGSGAHKASEFVLVEPRGRKRTAYFVII